MSPVSKINIYTVIRCDTQASDRTAVVVLADLTAANAASKTAAKAASQKARQPGSQTARKPECQKARSERAPLFPEV